MASGQTPDWAETSQVEVQLSMWTPAGSVIEGAVKMRQGSLERANWVGLQTVDAEHRPSASDSPTRANSVSSRVDDAVEATRVQPMTGSRYGARCSLQELEESSERGGVSNVAGKTRLTSLHKVQFEITYEKFGQDNFRFS
jgi:hypothetical protein